MRSLSRRCVFKCANFSFCLRVCAAVAEVCASLGWLQLKTQLISHWERAVGRPKKRIAFFSPPLMEARDSWRSALTEVKQGLPQTSHLFCLKAHLFYPRAMLWKTSLMMIVIPSGLRCWNHLSSPVRCLSVTSSMSLGASAAYWSQKTYLT